MFPIHTVTQTKGEFESLPLPCCIAPGFFLGSRPVGSLERRFLKQLAYERPTLEKLGVTCVVVNGDASLGFDDTQGLQVHSFYFFYFSDG